VNPETPEAAKLLVVKLEREEQATDVLRILGVLGIPTTVVGDGARIREPGTVVVEVPFGHLREAMLSLALQGFADVRAYGREVVTDNDDTGGTRPA
jgi:hypothetical protein